jgi:cellulose synthase/poly-beta-1,6-N-acetylglucosamine synthase-like glycosyltransferase
LSFVDPGLPNRHALSGENTHAPSESAAADSAFFALPGTFTEWVTDLMLVAVSVTLAAIAATTLFWMLHAWRSTTHLRRTGFRSNLLPARHSFTLLVPGRHEEEVLGQTLDTLAKQDHPDFTIIAIVGDDDPGTAAVAHSAARRHPGLISVVVDDSVPKNKPKALNRALALAGGDIVGVFDAEDEVHPTLLSLIDARFTESDADVVQGGVQLMNFETSWWALRNVLEYYFWFRSRLHFHAESRIIPLGGNTVFITRSWLESSNGWDAECLAEDCELGIRLSSRGAKVVVAYGPEVVTREETPGSFASLFKQRTRWNQGFLQVLRKGEWKKLPNRRQRLLALYLLTMPFLQALIGLFIPVAILMVLMTRVEPFVAMISFLPLSLTVITLAVEAVGLAEFGRLYERRVRGRDYARLVLGMFPYQLFLGAAAIRAVYRERRGLNGWEKTEHTGAHRLPAVPLGQGSLVAAAGDRSRVL